MPVRHVIVPWGRGYGPGLLDQEMIVENMRSSGAHQRRRHATRDAVLDIASVGIMSKPEELIVMKPSTGTRLFGMRQVYFD